MTAQRPLARGVLVALEGIDGTGKSTQARRLAGLMSEQGYAVTLLREPTLSPWGRRIREAATAGFGVLAPSQELELFLRDRLYDVAAHIHPALAARQLVLMDRYYFSTVAYQGARGFDPEHIRCLNETFAPVPDLVLLLMMPPAQALERIRQARGQTDDVFERENHLTNVDRIYRTLLGPQVHCVDAAQPIDSVTAALQQKVHETLSSCLSGLQRGGESNLASSPQGGED